MTRTIKASEVKPGMTIQFNLDGWEVKGAVSRVEPVTFGLDFYSTQGVEMTLGEDTPVTVLAEPQPEEPTEFGARVVVNGRRGIRGDNSVEHWWVEDVGWHSWDELCEMGPVTVIPDQGWTAPETPEVPERVEEWPEDDTALRPYPWEDIEGCPWRFFGEDDWRFKAHSGYWSYPHPTPADGPWTRATDA